MTQVRSSGHMRVTCLTEAALLRMKNVGLDDLGACTDRLLSCKQQSLPLGAPHTRLARTMLSLLPQSDSSDLILTRQKGLCLERNIV